MDLTNMKFKKEEGLDISSLSKEIFKANKEKGFWPKDSEKRNISEVLMLIVTELAEAMEAVRDDNFCELTSLEKLDLLKLYYEDKESFKKEFELKVKNTFEDELTDALIRILDAMGGYNIDLTFHLLGKLTYNSTRPHKHGKNF